MSINIGQEEDIQLLTETEKDTRESYNITIVSLLVRQHI